VGDARTITRDGASVLVSYPASWDRSFAWRHLLANPPEGVRQPRRQSHRQLWTKAHTSSAWAWRAPVVAEDAAA
jgi:hypothetical protein